MRPPIGGDESNANGAAAWRADGDRIPVMWHRGKSVAPLASRVEDARPSPALGALMPTRVGGDGSPAHQTVHMTGKVRQGDCGRGLV